MARRIVAVKLLTIVTAVSLFESSEKAVKSALPPRQALLLSLLLHGFVLAALTDVPSFVTPGVAPPERLQVFVRMLPVTLPAENRENASRMPSPPRGQRVIQPVSGAASQQGAASPAPTLRMESLQPSPSVQATVPGSIPQPKAVEAPVSVAVAPSEEAAMLDAAGLREFRLALASEARRVRNYPEAARRAGLIGVSEILVSVNAAAQRHTELVRSSGHAILDQAALAMLRTAAERTPLPASLQGREFAVLLPVVFEIEE